MATIERQRLEDTITFLLKNAPAALSRTALMKLLYFADLRSYEQRGKALTRIQWVWHHYGPFSRQVYEVLDALELNSEVQIDVTPTIMGNPEYQIVAGPKAGYYRVLDGKELDLLRGVVKEFSRFTPQQLARLSYWTTPMATVDHRGEALDFDIYSADATRPEPFKPDSRIPVHPKMRSTS